RHMPVTRGAMAIVLTVRDLLTATIALGMLILVTVASLRPVVRRVPYEWWRYVHAFAYPAIALAFVHQLTLGVQFLSDGMARHYWVGLHLAAVWALLRYRIFQVVRLNLRHQLHVEAVRPE